MSRPAAWLLGPEVLWLVLIGLVWLAGWRNTPASEAGNQLLERLWWWLPLLGVPLSFACYLLPEAGRWGLLLRIDLACLAGLIITAGQVAGAIDYHDSRNSGVLAGWVMSVGLGIVLLLPANLLAALWLWRGAARGSGA